MEYRDKTIRCAGCGRDFVVVRGPSGSRSQSAGCATPRAAPRLPAPCLRVPAPGGAAPLRRVRPGGSPRENRPVLCAECHVRRKGARASESE
jgi:hypothetical protein